MAACDRTRDYDYVQTVLHVCEYVKHASEGSGLFTWAPNVAVQDGSGYFARLIVKEDFGCVNFEARASDSLSPRTGRT